jgi:hypothetical protein
MNRIAAARAILLGLLFSCHLALSAQTPAPTPDTYVKDNYVKREERITMRDGVKLFTSIYIPKDATQKYPIMLNRTPYTVSPYGPDQYKTSLGPSELFTREGYIFVYQDVRGRWLSEGEYVNVRPHNPAKKAGEIDESTDTYDTIEWLVKNLPNNNGRVGMWGISYPGFYVSAGIIDSHPALKAVSPQAPIADWFIGDDFHHNGALFLPHAFNFLASFGQPRPAPSLDAPKRFVHGTPDGYQFFLNLGPMKNAAPAYRDQLGTDIAFWNEMMAHPNYDDFWQARNLRPHLKNIKPAVMTVGGWFDAEDLFGALETYRSIEKQNPNIYNIMVMGPWFHGGWSRGNGDGLGHVRFGGNQSVWYRERIELPFFNFYLKHAADGSRLNFPDAIVFETGANQWRSYETWPPKNAAPREIYLRENGKLAWDAPPDAPDASDEYLSDPSKPVPFISNIAIGMTREYMVDDQREASRRPDVLVYQTEPLTENLTIAGPIEVSLNVSTTGTDADFVVKLIDVYPPDAPDNVPNPSGMRMGGYQMLLRGEPFRARFRNSFTRPEPMKPGQATPLKFVMPDAFHTFKKGHRLMVQVQSTWFPLVDRNPQKYVENINLATEADFQKATQRVYRTRKTPSWLRLFVLNR